jgi:cation:H+ antiporter
LTPLAILELVGGFGILSVGGHYLVEGSTRIALLAKISTSVVGLTIVAMGTSMPELAVSIGAAARGAPDISYGNVVGSNIFNIAVILAVTALIKPIPVTRRTIKLEYPFMVVACWILLLLSRDGTIDRLEAAFFLFSLLAFTVYIVLLAREDVAEDEANQLSGEVTRLARIEGGIVRAWGVNVLLVVLGIATLAAGAELMVRGAIAIAADLGVGQRVIGLTVVAMGTSLPELATSVIAARRGDQAIALGNIVGSNIFNVLAILGVTASIFPVPVNPASIRIDNWVMLAFVIGIFPLMLWGKRVSRFDGILLLAGFAVYLAFLLQHP